MAASDQEKTEEPTPKKLQKARSEGNVPKSQEVSAFISLLIAFVIIFALFWYVSERIMQLYGYYMGLIGEEFTVSLMIHVAIVSAYKFIMIMLPIVGALMLAGIIANVSQFGFLLTTKVFKLNFKKLNPITGVKNLISLKKIMDGGMVTLKVFTAFGVGAAVYYYFFSEVDELILLTLEQQLIWFKEKALILIAALLFVFL